MATPMSALPMRDDAALREKIREAEAKLEGLESDLQGVDSELDKLVEQRTTYELLEQTCEILETLGELGADGLFWGEGCAGKTEEHVTKARNRAHIYAGRLAQMEQRRDSLTQEIARGHDVLRILEDDLYEFVLEEEERKSEWEIERDLVEPARVIVMPWTVKGEDDRRLRKTLLASALVALLLGAIIPMVELPLPDLELIPEVPERFAELIEREAPPPPPPPVIEEPAPEPEPILAEELPEEVPETLAEPTPTVADEPAPEQEVRSAGILAFRESFASIAESRQPAQLGAQARINDAGEAAVGRTERAMITSQAPGSSGGINLASISRDVGGGGGPGLDGVEVTRVASSIGISGDGDRPLAAGAMAGRTDEEIQIVFDRHKAALYRLYNRELRNNPTLRGQVVLQLTIEPDGSVSFCEVQGSDMNAPALEQQVVDRVKTFDFGAKEDIATITILYPIDFLPAA